MNMHARQPRPAGLTIAEFLAFTETRPQGERWELIEGQPVLCDRPVIIDRIIVGNVLNALWSARSGTSASWLPMLGIGVIVPVSGHSLPTPDLHVIEHPGLLNDDSHATPDSLVLIEVLSRSNTKARRDWRRKVYASVPNCQHYLTISTKKIEIRRYDRANDWAEEIVGPDTDRITLQALETQLTIADIYRHTRLK